MTQNKYKQAHNTNTPLNVQPIINVYMNFETTLIWSFLVFNRIIQGNLRKSLKFQVPELGYFSMCHFLVNLYKDCSDYTPGAKKTCQRGHCFCLDLFKENFDLTFYSPNPSGQEL